MYLFFDTETTGLSYDSIPGNQPRMVQIAWIVFDKQRKKLKEENYIIKPEGYTIPTVVANIHGITTEIANKQGHDLQKILKKFVADLKKVKYVVAHNIAFDQKVVAGEFHRKGITVDLQDKNPICTMKLGTDICKIQKKGSSAYKRPNLQELHMKLFNTGFDGAHDALVDVVACANCFWEMFSDSPLDPEKILKTRQKIEKEKEKLAEDGNDEILKLKKLRKIKSLKPKVLEKPTITLDPIAESVLDLMQHTEQNIFLTGKAGTGKSTLLRHFIETTQKNIVVLAPTGVAALNVGGSTIHSFFRFSSTITYEEAKKDAKRSVGKSIYTKLQTIVIDEISMVRSDMIDCIDIFLKTVRKMDLPFGGVQMIWIGDLYQLPPVVSFREKNFFTGEYKSIYFFGAKIFQDPRFTMKFVELQKVYRQSDQVFIDILNAIRNKAVDENHIAHLNKNVVGNNYEIIDGNMFLTGINAKAESINDAQLQKLSGKSRIFRAKTTGRMSEKHYPTDEILELKVGAQVMFVANDSLGQRVNGTVGKILSMEKDYIEVQIYGGEIVIVTPHAWRVKQYTFDGGKLGSEVVGSFTQLPLMLAWAITIHKSQGKTFEKVIIDLGSGIFAHGQTYVALSRCISLDGLSLVSPIQKHHVILDHQVVDFVTNFTKQQEI